MIMLKRYNLSDPLDREAMDWTRWAEQQPGLLPLDNRLFLDKRPPVIQVLDEQTPDEFDIKVL